MASATSDSGANAEGGTGGTTATGEVPHEEGDEEEDEDDDDEDESVLSEEAAKLTLNKIKADRGNKIIDIYTLYLYTEVTLSTM